MIATSNDSRASDARAGAGRTRGARAVLGALGGARAKSPRGKRGETYLRRVRQLAGPSAWAPLLADSLAQERSMRVGRASGLVSVDLPADAVLALGRSWIAEQERAGVAERIERALREL